jgi:hypothetical protein
LFTSPLALHAQTTMLFLNSQPGDFVGAGLQQTITEVDGTFNARRNVDNGVSITFQSAGATRFWNVDMAAAGATLLTAGVYEGAIRFPFQPVGQPGLSISGDGRGCNTLTGHFEVFEVTFGPGDTVVSFAAGFEQHCEGNTPALSGFMLFNSGVPVPPGLHLTLTGCTHCHAGDPFGLEAHVTNPGTTSIAVEFKLGLRRPDGTGSSLFGAATQHLVVTLPAGLDSTFPVLNMAWPGGLPAGVWHVEGTLLEVALGKTFSRDVQVFDLAP